jgi:hypothetical protein
LPRINATCSSDGHFSAHARVGRVDTDGILAEEVWKEFANREHTLRVLVGKWLEEHGVDKRKDGGVRADANGERKNSGRGEAGISMHSVKCIPEVLGEGV